MTPVAITREETRALLARGAHLVEALPEAEYAARHLPGAINIPIKALDARSTARLRKRQPIIVYCQDTQ